MVAGSAASMPSLFYVSCPTIVCVGGTVGVSACTIVPVGADASPLAVVVPILSLFLLLPLRTQLQQLLLPEMMLLWLLLRLLSGNTCLTLPTQAVFILYQARQPLYVPGLSCWC